MSLPQYPRRAPDSALAAAVKAAEIPAGSRLLVAVSGGPDSTALLHVLADQAPAHGWALCVAHINHNLRGDESAADEAFVRLLALDLGLPIRSEAVHTEEFAKTQRMSIETAARTLRYAALRGMLATWPGDLIITGHTLDDQAETVLMHLLRGSGLTGLSGMKPRTGDVVRPLLGITHDAIMQYLAARGLPYRTDSSNRDRGHARNRVRHELIPALAQFEPTVQEHLSATASLLRQDARYLDAETVAAARALSAPTGGLDLAGWKSLHPALRRSLLRRLLDLPEIRPAGIPSRAVLALEQTLRALTPRSRSRVTLAGGVDVWVNEGRITTDRDGTDSMTWQESEVRVPGEITLPVGTMSAREEDRIDRLSAWLAVLGPWHSLFDAGSLGHGLMVRTRQPGDRMRPLGSPGRRKVQDIMVDAQVPALLRATWPLIAHGDEIIWIPGVARSATALIEAGTTRIMHLSFRPADCLYRGRIPRHFP